jgi:hypothetical protein
MVGPSRDEDVCWGGGRHGESPRGSRIEAQQWGGVHGLRHDSRRVPVPVDEWRAPQLLGPWCARTSSRCASPTRSDRGARWWPVLGYCHLDSRTVSRCDRVKRGDKVGVMGSTGNADAKHCAIQRSSGYLLLGYQETCPAGHPRLPISPRPTFWPNRHIRAGQRVHHEASRV